MGKRDEWLEKVRQRNPGLHRWLTSDDERVAKQRAWAKDIGGFLAIVLVGGILLWGVTGQDFPDAPVVVIESGSMMHCEGARGIPDANRCEAPFARLGTIDPGDLIFVQDVDGRDEIITYAEGEVERYNRPGDVILYYPEGDRTRTPIIHRAMFWLEVHEDGTFSVPELGIDHDANLTALFSQENAETYRVSPFLPQALKSLANATDDEGNRRLGPDDSGFITLGDNNLVADQGGNPNIGVKPVHPDWILGKARGELPWIGVAKLLVTKLTGGPPFFDYAPADSKGIVGFLVVAFVAGPWVVEKVRGRTEDEDEHLAHGTAAGLEADAGTAPHDTGPEGTQSTETEISAAMAAVIADDSEE